MRRRHQCARAIAITLAVGGAASRAHAQTPPGPTFRPIFGGAQQISTSRGNLSAILTVTEASDSNVAEAAAAGVLTTPYLQSGPYTEISPLVNGGWKGNRLQFAATASSSFRAYGQDVFNTTNFGQVGMNAQLSNRTKIAFGQGLTYAPAYMYGLSSGAALPPNEALPPPTSNDVLTNERSYVSGTTVSLAHNLSDRTVASLNSDFQYTRYVGDLPGYSNLHFYHAGAALSHGVSRDFKFRFGYHLGRGQYMGLSGETTEHTLDFGFDYVKPHSATRKTTLSFGLGPTLVDGPLLGQTLPLFDNGRQYGASGHLSLTHQVSRTWIVQGNLQRGLTYVQGFSRPGFTSNAGASASGFLNRRTDLSLSASYTASDTTVAGATPFTTYTGDARVRTALDRTFALYGEYLYYFYDYNRGFSLPIGVPSRLNRSTVRIGVTMWIPVRDR